MALTMATGGGKVEEYQTNTPHIIQSPIAFRFLAIFTSMSFFIGFQRQMALLGYLPVMHSKGVDHTKTEPS